MNLWSFVKPDVITCLPATLLAPSLLTGIAGNFYTDTPGGCFPPGEWFHLAATVTGTQAVIYRNGGVAAVYSIPPHLINAPYQLFGSVYWTIGPINEWTIGPINSSVRCITPRSPPVKRNGRRVFFSQEFKPFSQVEHDLRFSGSTLRLERGVKTRDVLFILYRVLYDQTVTNGVWTASKKKQTDETRLNLKSPCA